VTPELTLCPHCGSQTVINDGVCGVCGGPRIPDNRGGEPAIKALKEQRKYLAIARNASIATVFQGLFATMATLIGIIVQPEAITAKAIIFFLAAMPLVLALRSRSKAVKNRGFAAEAGERAWQAAAEDVAKGGVTAEQAAKKLRIEPDRAEKLLKAGAATDRVRVDIHDESAEVVYRSGAEDEYADQEDAEASRAHQRRG
jgi:hypothetical protein